MLDEAGEIPLELQSKFLRVLQEHQYERVGEEKTRTVNVRVIAASNRDLQAEVAAGRFRHDLYYRLNVFPIEVAPLRHHKEDIPLLAAHFLEQAARRLKLPQPQLTPAHLAHLRGYDWPGNVRELQNLIERAVILSQKGPLCFELTSTERSGAVAPPPPVATEEQNEAKILSEAELRQRERDNLLAALHRAGSRIHGPGGAAELLRINPSTLISRIKRLGLKKPG